MGGFCASHAGWEQAPGALWDGYISQFRHHRAEAGYGTGSDRKAKPTRVRAGVERAHRERCARLEEAWQEIQRRQAKVPEPEREQVRVSVTECEARHMKHGNDGGISPSYNLQLSTDAKDNVIVSMALSQDTGGAHQLLPAVERMQSQLRRTPQQMGSRWRIHDARSDCGHDWQADRFSSAVRAIVRRANGRRWRAMAFIRILARRPFSASRPEPHPARCAARLATWWSIGGKGPTREWNAGNIGPPAGIAAPARINRSAVHELRNEAVWRRFCRSRRKFWRSATR